jgi:hypothetical protein
VSNTPTIQPDDNLQSKLDEISISKEEQAEIASLEAGKATRDVIFDLFHLGAVTRILDTAEKIAQETEERKKAYLISAYLEKTDNVEQELREFEAFVTDPQGNILYSKVVRILNNYPINKYYTKLLAAALNKIKKSDFSSLFSEHIYALNQIEKLTPQALLLLSDYGNWPEFIIGNYRSDGEFIDSTWVKEFLLYYAPLKNIKDEGLIARMAHSFLELEQNEMIRSKVLNGLGSMEFSSVKEDKTKAMLTLTTIARDILEYIE